MAIIKEINTTKGPVTYWVVGLIQLDNFSKSAYLKLLGFFDEDHADMESASPIETVEINIHPDQYDDFFGGTDVVKKAYEIFSNSVIHLNEEGTMKYDLTGGTHA